MSSFNANRDLSDIESRKENLEGADLSRANLREADLSEANLSQANLYRVDLGGADLSEANLSQANLAGAYLYRADLRGADLSEANLSQANLGWANLEGANLKRANLLRANLSRANLSQANLKRAKLLRANLSQANLGRVAFSQANLERADLRVANLAGADLVGANLSGANLEVASLRGVTGLTQAMLDCVKDTPLPISLPEGLEWPFPDDSETGIDNPMYVQKVGELALSMRSANCLRNVNIVYIGELVQKHERELLSAPNLGRTSLAEIKDALGKIGLQLGMELPGWPPDIIEELSRKEKLARLQDARARQRAIIARNRRK